MVSRSVDEQLVFFKLSFYGNKNRAKATLNYLKKNVTEVIKQKRKIKKIALGVEKVKDDEGMVQKCEELNEKTEELAEEIFEELLINREACKRLEKSEDNDLAKFASQYEKGFSSLLLEYKSEFDFTKSFEKICWYSFLGKKDLLEAELQLVCSLRPRTKNEEKEAVRLCLFKSEICRWFSKYPEDRFGTYEDYQELTGLAKEYEDKFRRAAYTISRNSIVDFDDVGVGYI
jgi:hypothetical protein